MEAREMVVRQLPSLRRYASCLAHNRMHADDLVQDTVTRALGRIHLWQSGSDMRAWLFAIMHNLHVNTVRRSIRNASREAPDIPLRWIGASQEFSVELNEVKSALAKLPGDVRTAICLVGVDGLSYQQVSERLGVPVGTVKSRLARGRRRLLALTEGQREATPRPEMLPTTNCLGAQSVRNHA